MRYPLCHAAMLTAASALLAAPGPDGYYRQPSLHADTVVFVSEGDLWRVPLSGGQAVRLTSHPGDELHPAISPDGGTVAFAAEYEGPTEIYTMPIDGGLPVRRTYGAARVTFVGWTPDARILYSTREFATLPSSQLVAIDPATGAKSRVPLYEADQGEYAADGKTLFFTRLPMQGSHTKRYRGGYIQQLWRFAEGDNEAAPLTADFPGTSKDPMFWQGRVYFLSDRDGYMNIWSMNPDGKDLKQHTSHADLDAASASISGGRIVYQHGADLWSLDTATGKSARIPITITSDLDQTREFWVREPLKQISSYSLSPDGDRLALTARGRVFIAPAKAGRLVLATRDPGVRYREARFSPDGKSILALSDRSGEIEFWSLPANGVGEAEPITSGADVLRWEGVHSPDGKLLAHHDKAQRLFLTDLETKTTTLIARNPIDRYAGLAWSPDSRWLAFVEPAPNMYSRVRLYSVASANVTDVTSDRYDSFSPRFSPDGKWLYFLSDRHLRSIVESPWGALAPHPFFDKRTRIYAASLKAGTRSPWQPKDELAPKDDPKKPADAKPASPATPPAPSEPKSEPRKDEAAPGVKVEIELEGLPSRLIEVPVPPGNYSNLFLNDKTLFFGSADAAAEPKTNLLAVAITSEKPEVKTVAPDVKGFELSADGKKLLVRKDDTFAVVDAQPAPAELDKARVDLSGVALAFVPAAEWKQMYADAWRLLRDYFYALNMHGVDWPAMRAKYQPLVDRVRSRDELNDVLAQLTGELSTLHHFVRGGDMRDGPDRIALSWLGGDLVPDAQAGGWRILRVYTHDPDDPSKTPPLARPGVDARAGDIITHINGVPALSAPDPAALLRNQAGRQVLLRIRPAGAAPEDARDAVVVPVSSQQAADLRYSEWELTRRAMVEDWGKGDIGYVHLRAMGTENIAEWARGFFPVFNRKGLIIDVRRNNGGNIDSWILGHLMRKAWMYWNQRYGRAPSWNMQYAFRGHVVVVCDSFTASDGEAFAEGFKRLGLGKVIGTRTWGGEIWLSSSNTLSDDGLASAGEFGVFGPEGVWLVEGHGVDPDIVVDNPPHATFNGADAQLRAAVDHLLKSIADKPVDLPPVPAFPDKSFRNAPGGK
ncbi:MAG: PD40 domain-containing protein [Phycisphaerae bacterium]|nr:PD40 domain-containing protein [Phycisphaerae bacterium]